MPAQLALFPQKRRSTKVLEFPKCCVIADAARRFLVEGWDWTHLPFGEYRTAATAGRLKRMGVNGGWPDYVFLNPARVCHWIEVKREGEKRKPEQDRLGELFVAASVPYLCSANVGEILRTLQAWGALQPTARF